MSLMSEQWEMTFSPLGPATPGAPISPCNKNTDAFFSTEEQIPAEPWK